MTLEHLTTSSGSDGNVFRASEEDLLNAGNKIKKSAEDFRSYYLSIYSIIEALIGHEWVSPAAEVIAKKIEEQRPSLKALENTIIGYSDYCFRTKERVRKNEEGIIAGVSGNGD